MKTTTKNKGNKAAVEPTLEAIGFVEIKATSIPVNVMDYSDVTKAGPVDGNGSSALELELNARSHFISKRMWQDFGVLIQAPQLKSNRTGEVDDARYFEIANDRGEYAQCTMINSAKNVDSGGVYGHQKLFGELTTAFNNATANGEVVWIKTTTRDPNVWKSTQGGAEPFIWFDGVQVSVYSS